RADSSGKTARRLWAIAARVCASRRHAIHVPTRPIPYDTHGGSRLTPRYVQPKIVPLFSPCSVQRRGSSSRRSAACAVVSPIGSDTFEEAIVHRQKTGTRGIGHRPQLALLPGVNGRDRT